MAVSKIERKALFPTEYGTGTDISSTTSFTVPREGVVFVSAHYSAGSYARVYADEQLLAQCSSGSGQAGPNVTTVPVHTGQVLRGNVSNTSNCAVTYRPYQY